MALKLLWLQGLSCNGNAHSFFNVPDMAGVLREFAFIYHPLLPCEATLEEVSGGDFSPDVLIVEGALRRDGVPRGDEEALTLITRYAKRAKWVVCAGQCAVFGGIFRLNEPDKIAGALYAGKERGGFLDAFEKKIINLPGCPVHPEWLLFTLRMLALGTAPRLDDLRRPVELYGYTVHEGCLRNEYFEWKVDARDFGAKEGCLFYEQGCRGPYTRGSCNKILWNGVNSKTRAGMPCIGCTEPDFPAERLFETETLMSIPARLPLEVPKRAYLTLTGMAKAFRIPRLTRRKFGEEEP
ncbi:MAG: hydrogenase [Epsilonproteobacteria bacterium]|nr:hydrogenase [Campylobacterota bacterium]